MAKAYPAIVANIIVNKTLLNVIINEFIKKLPKEASNPSPFITFM